MSKRLCEPSFLAITNLFLFDFFRNQLLKKEDAQVIELL